MTITRRQITWGIVAVAALVAILVAGLKWREARQFSETRMLLSRFPVEDAIVLNVDFAAVRAAGLLDESKNNAKTPLEPEAKQFLDGTGFDFHKDLDSVTASFSKSGYFYIARGRFNWPKLRDYAAHQSGSCYEDLCRMPGSTPERRISFLPLRDDTMALAVSTDDLAANRLTKQGDPLTTPLPSAPAWVLIPGSAVHELAAVDPGLGLMLSALNNADRLVVTVGLSGSGLAAKMEAICRNPEDARVLASQLRTVTAKLKDAMQQTKEAQSDDMVRVLAGGTFDDSGTKVNGQWPVSRSMIADLTAGI